MQIKRSLDDREVYAGIDCLMLRGTPILRKPLLTEGVFFLKIEERFFLYLCPREAYNGESIGMFFGGYCRDQVVKH